MGIQNTSGLTEIDYSTDMPTFTTTAQTSTMIVTDSSLKVINIVIGLLGLFGNSFVIIVILSYQKMRRLLTNYFIVNQSLLDSAASIFLVLTHVFEGNRTFDRNFLSDQVYCRLWLTKLPLWGLLVSSTFNLVGLTFERYLAVVHPIWHKLKFTKVKVMICLIFAWIIGPAYNLSYIVSASAILDDGTCTIYSQYPNVITQRAIGLLSIFIQFFLPLAIIILLYCKMALALRKCITRMESGKQRVKGQRRAGTMTHARRNVIRTLWFVCACFVLCWSGNQFYFLFFNLGLDAASNLTSTFYHLTVAMVFCNCCVNPLIYTLKYDQFRRGIKKLFKYEKRCGRTFGIQGSTNKRRGSTTNLGDSFL